MFLHLFLLSTTSIFQPFLSPFPTFLWAVKNDFVLKFSISQFKDLMCSLWIKYGFMGCADYCILVLFTFFTAASYLGFVLYVIWRFSLFFLFGENLQLPATPKTLQHVIVSYRFCVTLSQASSWCPAAPPDSGRRFAPHPSDRVHEPEENTELKTSYLQQLTLLAPAPLLFTTRVSHCRVPAEEKGVNCSSARVLLELHAELPLFKGIRPWKYILYFRKSRSLRFRKSQLRP